MYIHTYIHTYIHAYIHTYADTEPSHIKGRGSGNSIRALAGQTFQGLLKRDEVSENLRILGV